MTDADLVVIKNGQCIPHAATPGIYAWTTGRTWAEGQEVSWKEASCDGAYRSC